MIDLCLGLDLCAQPNETNNGKKGRIYEQVLIGLSNYTNNVSFIIKLFHLVGNLRYYHRNGHFRLPNPEKQDLFKKQTTLQEVKSVYILNNVIRVWARYVGIGMCPTLMKHLMFNETFFGCLHPILGRRVD